MSAEVDWVLDTLQSVVDDYADTDHPLKRVNRDDSELLEGSIRSREADLQEANYVGATLADFDGEPIGTEFNQNTESIVGVRIEGLHHSEWGHVDPDGVDGVQFDAPGGLVDQIKTALQAEREFPSVGHPDISFKSLYIGNEAPQSADWADYYRYDFDVRLTGHETLP
jgi:hypothetical protein